MSLEQELEGNFKYVRLEQTLEGNIKACILQVMEVPSGRWSPTSAQDQLGGEEEEEELLEQVVGEGVVEVNEDRQGLGIMGLVRKALVVIFVLMILYIILVPAPQSV